MRIVTLIADSLASDEELQMFQALVKQFQVGYPDWDGQPISPESSVEMMLDVVSKLDIESTGKFISQHGDQNWL